MIITVLFQPDLLAKFLFHLAILLFQNQPLVRYAYRMGCTTSLRPLCLWVTRYPTFFSISSSKKRWKKFSRSVTTGGQAPGIDIYLRLHPLPGDLAWFEFGNRKYSMLCPVGFHEFFHFSMSFRLFSGSFISIKSTTIIPPRSLTWADGLFHLLLPGLFQSAFCSGYYLHFYNRCFASITCKASVCSIIR